MTRGVCPYHMPRWNGARGTYDPKPMEKLYHMEGGMRPTKPMCRQCFRHEFGIDPITGAEWDEN